MSQKTFFIPFNPYFVIPMKEELIKERLSTLDYNGMESFIALGPSPTGTEVSLDQYVGKIKNISWNGSQYIAEIELFVTDYERVCLEMLESGDFILGWQISIKVAIKKNKLFRFYYFYKHKEEYISKILRLYHFFFRRIKT